ncbi:uncharacterized protein PV09_06565 [Verruconis gallopava]|uniref:SET domain-containing protein n=1 Tax=Verruconis gallopava TaxID=253628 RepID=A0A0D2A6A0_9PEZI|nr:uncharacterized protein PV09_06565 [Verruconis gallopava]KIW02070.1 hypothetical protein PV09_06565 [Verruconis gallopava]
MVNLLILLSSYLLSVAAATYPSTCSYFTGKKHDISNLLSLKALNHTCHGQTNIYQIRMSPGKGLGVFALHDLEVGTVIMREAPILKIKPPKYAKGSGYPMAAVSQMLRQDYAFLSTEDQEEVMSLAYYGTEEEKNASDPLGLIFRTNAYKSGEEIGLFPKIARINHSCRPNTSYYWNAQLNLRVMYANRKIKKGEEILDSYISLLLPQEERQKLLKPYGFTCNCEVCSARKKARRESDRRRTTIKKGFVKLAPQLTLGVPADNEAKKQAAEDARLSAQLAELVEKEGLADYYATAYRTAALSFARVEDWQSATIWANKGYEWRVMEDPTSSYALEMHKLTSDFIEQWKSELRKKSLLKDGI